MTRRIFAGTIRKLRNEYFDTWERQWPHDDKYLAELWLDSRKDLNNLRGSQNLAPVYERTLLYMRENHEFEVVS